MLKDRILSIFYNWSIQLKLVTIISIIIIVSITGIIYLATYFFKQDNEVRIKEKNLELTELIAGKTRSDLSNIIRSARELSFVTAKGRISYIQNKSFIQDPNSISDSEEIVAIYLYGLRGNNPYRVRSVYNTFFLKQMQWNQSKLDQVIDRNAKFYGASGKGEIIVRNSSIDSEPLLGVSAPFRSSDIRFFIAVTKMDILHSAFKSSGITDNFLLSDDGMVLVHTKKELIPEFIDYSELSIFNKIKSSPINNGQTNYQDEAGVVFIASFKKIGLAGLTVVTTVPEEKAMEEVNNIQRRNFFLMVIILNLSILVVLVYSKKLTKPILKLVDASHQIEKGDFHVTLEQSSGDEIGILTKSFGNMAKGLSERDKIKDAFGKFVNTELAEKVLHGEISLGGSRRECSIFFSDIRNFTATSEDMEPESVVEFLNEYMTEMVSCVNANRGVVDKFIGDSIMAIWGAISTTENDTERAIDTALMMRKKLIQLNERHQKNDKMPYLRIGIGINTGDVIAGQIGSEERLEFTVVGDAVNLASRIEALNKEFDTDILISESSLEKVPDLYSVVKMKSIHVKGKSKAQTIYAVLGRKEDSSSPKNLVELRKILASYKVATKKKTGVASPKKKSSPKAKKASAKKKAKR